MGILLKQLGTIAECLYLKFFIQLLFRLAQGSDKLIPFSGDILGNRNVNHG